MQYDVDGFVIEPLLSNPLYSQRSKTSTKYPSRAMYTKVNASPWVPYGPCQLLHL